MSTIENAPETPVEMSFPKGCPLCGGELWVRFSPRTAWSCCAKCRWITQPMLRAGRGAMELDYVATLQA